MTGPPHRSSFAQHIARFGHRNRRDLACARYSSVSLPKLITHTCSMTVSPADRSAFAPCIPFPHLVVTSAGRFPSARYWWLRNGRPAERRGARDPPGARRHLCLKSFEGFLAIRNHAAGTPLCLWGKFSRLLTCHFSYLRVSMPPRCLNGKQNNQAE